MNRLTALAIISTLLVGCSSTPTPTVVTRYETIYADIPSELLRCEKAPNPTMLLKVRFSRGKDEAKRYTKSLLLANFKNCKKIEAIKKLVD